MRQRCSTYQSWHDPHMHERDLYRRGSGIHFQYYDDLDYDDEGMGIITREHHAFIRKRAGERALRAVREGVAVSVNGKDVRVRADCICVHSDTPNAIELVHAAETCGGGYLS